MKKQIISFSLIAAGFFLGATALSALAQNTGTWTSPQCSPPNCNVPAPINVGSSAQAKTGLLGLSNFLFLPPGMTSVTPGSVLMASSTGDGLVTWGTIGNSTLGNKTCPSYQFVQGFDATGNIICNFTRSIATIQVNADEQVVINIEGTSITLTNTTRGGASLTTDSFADPVKGMPTDGKPLMIANLASNDGNAAVLSPCPAGSVIGNNTGMSDRMCIYQQPSASNNYTTMVWIWDGANGAHSWSFDLDYAN